MRYKKALLPLALIASLLCGFVIAYTYYTLTVQHQMSIGIHRELEFRVEGIAYTSWNWGNFLDDEAKNLTATLHNLGTIDHVVTWNASIPSGWTFTISGWIEGTNKTITVDNYIDITLCLTEVSAYAGNYVFDLDFNVIE